MEDLIPESPIQRRKPGDSQPGSGYNSADDSGDDLFVDYKPVQTLPLHNNPLQSLSSTWASQRLPSPSQRITQPTQLIDRSTLKPDCSDVKSSVVQVAASSPLKPPSVASPPAVQRAGGVLANSMAPPGTAFRLPHGVRPAPKPPVINISDDDGPTYRGGSSDDEPQAPRRGDIKPAKFTKGSRDAVKDRVEESPAKNDPRQKFSAITSSSFYQPLPNGRRKPEGSSYTGSVYDSRNRDEDATSSKHRIPLKRSADTMANAYGGSRNPKQPRQSGPSPAKPVPPQDKKLEDVPDFQVRRKIEEIQKTLPWASVLICESALIEKRGSFEDAMDYLSTHPEATVDLTVSDDELSGEKTKMHRAPARQQVNAPTKTIAEKWSSTQNVPKPTLAPKPMPTVSPVTTPKKPRKRLMRGRKHSSSPALPSPQSTVIEVQSPAVVSSGSDIAASESEPEAGTDESVLNFINSCSVKELADLTSAKAKEVEFLLSHRPFKSLGAVRAVRSVATKSGKGAKGKPVGERILEKCEDMWLGYEAVDLLVKECESLGKPVAEEMKKWGVDIFGKEELDLLDLKELSPKKADASLNNESGLITPADEDSDATGTTATNSRLKKLTSRTGFISQPALMSKDVTLKDYQIVGINWLSLLFRKKLSCILADDMGLGKTCQVIGFIAHLSEIGVKGPHLVVVPPATLENWLREFSVFCPNLNVQPYYGRQDERAEQRVTIERNADIDVVVTTYTMAKQKDDLKWLRKRSFCVCVFDEGHMLKNSKSEAYNQLIRIPAEFRLLLTGTPLQNNLIELISLLAFIMPGLFKERREDLDFIFSHKARTSDENHDALLSAQRVARARSMLKPFVLRRKKHQVLSTLPKKTHRVEYCELSAAQSEIYTSELDAVKKMIQDNLDAGKKGGSGKNNMMRLRQAAIHPLLFRHIYNDKILKQIVQACLGEEFFQDSDEDLIFEDMTYMTDSEIHRMCEQYPRLNRFALQNEEWLDSGKVTKLVELLLKFKENGDRTLVFSQFTLVLDILDYVMETLEIRNFRLDGSTKVEERQDMLDAFKDDPEISVFMLSTKAGGTGINLACANKVIIFDMSFNPQDDIQAENRAHRVGSTRDVEVIRLVTKGTIEEQMFKMGQSKVLLDERVAGVEGDVEQDPAAKVESEEVGELLVSKMMVETLKGGGESVMGLKINEDVDKKEPKAEDGVKQGPVHEAEMEGVEGAIR